MKLIKFDAARKAVEAAVRVDEVLRIRNEAEAMKAYARQAKDDRVLAGATVLKMRAERRLGELMAEHAKRFGKTTARGSNRHKKQERGSKNPTLDEAGIDKNLAKRARSAAKVPKRTFEAQVEAVGEEIISGAVRRVRQGDKKARRAAREENLAARQRALPETRYGVIYADPEWKFESWSEDTGSDRAAANHYPVSDIAAIRDRDVPKIAAEDCVCFLWATVPMLGEAMSVLNIWGFRYVSHFIWNKNRIGTGYWSRNKHELLLVGTRGNVPAPAMGDQWDSVIDADVGRHSEKPEVFHQLIEAYYPNLPKIELNRRGPPRDGWDAWGNEAEHRQTGSAHDDAARDAVPV